LWSRFLFTSFSFYICFFVAFVKVCSNALCYYIRFKNLFRVCASLVYSDIGWQISKIHKLIYSIASTESAKYCSHIRDKGIGLPHKKKICLGLPRKKKTNFPEKRKSFCLFVTHPFSHTHTLHT